MFLEVTSSQIKITIQECCYLRITASCAVKLYITNVTKCQDWKCLTFIIRLVNISLFIQNVSKMYTVSFPRGLLHDIYRKKVVSPYCVSPYGASPYCLFPGCIVT